MKKYFLLFIFIVTIMFTGCGKQPIISINQSFYYLEVGQQINLDIEVIDCDNPIFTYEFDNDGIIEINNNSTVTAISEGVVVVKIGLKDYSKSTPVEIVIDVYQQPYIKIEKEKDTIRCNETLQLTLSQVKVEGNIKWSSSDRRIANVSRDGLVTAYKDGTVTISVECDTYIDEFTLTVLKPLATEIVIEDYIQMEVNSSLALQCEILPTLSSQEYTVKSHNTSIIEINENNIIAKSMGETTITLTTTDGTNISKDVIISVIENEAPVILCNTPKIKINWNDIDSVYSGITATDNCDGDMTDRIQLPSEFDVKDCGVHQVEYKVVDKAGNETTFIREIEIVWNYDVKFIGHAGSYFGVMNSEEAIRYALEELHYQAVEIDLKQTSDGVFVLSHDTIITISDGTKINIELTTWKDLQKYTITETRNNGIPKQDGMIKNGTYTSKVCSLETYLNLCKQYNALAVIELKTSPGISNSSQKRMQALMDQIESQGMLKNVIFLTSQYKCLEWVKTNGYEYIECQYLVGSCESQTILDECIKFGFTVSINVTDYSNSEEWLAKYKAAGLKISTYTFSQWNPYSQVQEWINKGVDYVTCDFHLMEKLELPVKE